MRLRGCGKRSHWVKPSLWPVRILPTWLYDRQGEVVTYGAPVAFATNSSRRLGAFKSDPNNSCQESALLSSPRMTKRDGLDDRLRNIRSLELLAHFDSTPFKSLV